MFGPSPVLEAARRDIDGPIGPADIARAAALPPRTAWEHCALGRSLLRSGDLAAAAEEFERAVDRQPDDLWSNFYRGVCAYRLGRHEDAVNAFSICVTLAPETPECYYNRARARERLGQSERALRDYDRALQLAPTSAAFALDRGLLHYHEGRLDEAADDLRRARAHGADPAMIRHHLALVDLARKDRTSAPGRPRRPRRHDPALAGSHSHEGQSSVLSWWDPSGARTRIERGRTGAGLSGSEPEAGRLPETPDERHFFSSDRA